MAAGIGSRSPRIRNRFNPCSVGLEMAASHIEAAPVGPFEFQSLFCWIGDGGAGDSLIGGGQLFSFNPCSVGLEMAAAMRMGAWNCPAGFNPCSVGLEMAALTQVAAPLVIPEFQSLFCWIGDGGT